MSYRNYQNKSEEQDMKRRRKQSSKKMRVKLPPINRNLLIVVIMLMIFGIVAIFSASAPEGVDHYENPLYYPMRHLAFAAFGWLALFFISRIHYKNWERWVMPVSITIIALITMTLIPGLGKTDYGSSRWLTFLPIQPSEFGKFACILLMASCLSKVKNLKNILVLKHAGLIAFMMLIILLQPNMSMLVILGVTCLAMLLVAGINMTIVIGAIIAMLPIGGLIVLKHSYQLKRILGWLDPLSDPQGIGYNIIQSWYAIASGGLLGVGFGNSKQKLYYLPVAYTDFVFSVIAEESGFVGITVLVLLFLLFLHFGFKVATRCEDMFGRLLAFGIVFNIGFQAFVNMCVASGVFPVTGVTLPLISYGGSSFIVTCAMIGVLFNISRYSVKKERKQDEARQ
ncbi:MAG: putative lipid II flippase FtsW [bacterium]|nr:putative lipid II flippase FtsW [bacterium]